MKNQSIEDTFRVMEDCFYKVRIIYRSYREYRTITVPVLALSYEIAQEKAAEFVKANYAVDGDILDSVTCFKLINAL